MTLLAYVIFTKPEIYSWLTSLEILNGKIGFFIAGILTAFGFTSPIGVGLFLTLKPQNILAASLFGALGAIIVDLLIFKIIHISFLDEFKRLERTPPFKALEHEFKHDFTAHIRNYLLYIFAGIILASPLPDEVGVTMLAGLTKIKPVPLIAISFVLHIIGIYIILLISSF